MFLCTVVSCHSVIFDDHLGIGIICSSFALDCRPPCDIWYRLTVNLIHCVHSDDCHQAVMFKLPHSSRVFLCLAVFFYSINDRFLCSSISVERNFSTKQHISNSHHDTVGFQCLQPLMECRHSLLGKNISCSDCVRTCLSGFVSIYTNFNNVL